MEAFRLFYRLEIPAIFADTSSMNSNTTGRVMGDKKTALPPGIKPIWIQMKNYDTYGLRKEGADPADMNAFVPFVLLNRAGLIEEVGKFGFMCDWNDFKVGRCTLARLRGRGSHELL